MSDRASELGGALTALLFYKCSAAATSLSEIEVIIAERKGGDGLTTKYNEVIILELTFVVCHVVQTNHHSK